MQHIHAIDGMLFGRKRNEWTFLTPSHAELNASSFRALYLMKMPPIVQPSSKSLSEGFLGPSPDLEVGDSLVLPVTLSFLKQFQA